MLGVLVMEKLVVVATLLWIKSLGITLWIKSLVAVLAAVGSSSSRAGSALLSSPPPSIRQESYFPTVVRFISLLTNMMCIVHCAGLFFVIYLQEFGEARSKTAWVSFSFFKQILTGGVFEMQVGSLCSSVYLMYGPIVAAALTKFGRFSVSETFPNRFNHFVQAVGLS